MTFTKECAFILVFDITNGVGRLDRHFRSPGLFDVGKDQHKVLMRYRLRSGNADKVFTVWEHLKSRCPPDAECVHLILSGTAANSETRKTKKYESPLRF